ncbi:MAG: hypothetical protein NT113_12610 [Hyphomicrobiales bacterium]|jgi:hypothetical protein|nr:hypothetical protein [Hyphomicrobiales bacterium]
MPAAIATERRRNMPSSVNGGFDGFLARTGARLRRIRADWAGGDIRDDVAGSARLQITATDAI